LDEKKIATKTKLDMEDNETGSRQQEMQGKNSKKKFGRKQ
jgi:hypothetical protein